MCRFLRFRLRRDKKTCRIVFQVAEFVLQWKCDVSVDTLLHVNLHKQSACAHACQCGNKIFDFRGRCLTLVLKKIERNRARRTMSGKSKAFTKEEELLLQDFSRNVSTKSSALFYGNAFIVSAIPICECRNVHKYNSPDYPLVVCKFHVEF